MDIFVCGKHTLTHIHTQSVAECEIYKNYPFLIYKSENKAQNKTGKMRRQKARRKTFFKMADKAAKIAATAAKIAELSLGLRAEAKSCQAAAPASSLPLSLSPTF